MYNQKMPAVYVVDDDQQVRKSLKRLLSAHHYRVEVFESADSFLRFSRPDVAACLLLDVHLPESGGFELQDRLQSHDAPPIIFITGCGNIASSVRAMKAGAQDFLEKPFDEATLLEAIRSALKKDVVERAVKSRRRLYLKRFGCLTAREQEIMSHVVRGRLNKQIAHDLSIAEKTVKVHRGRVMEKMEVESLAELVLVADKIGLFSESRSLSGGMVAVS